MSDATAIAREWLHERSLSLERTEDLAAMLKAYAAEQTAAEAAKHADCCVDREELAALRAAAQKAVTFTERIAASLPHEQRVAWMIVRDYWLALLAAPEDALDAYVAEQTSALRAEAKEEIERAKREVSVELGISAMHRQEAKEREAALRYQIAQQDESIERLYEERNAWKTEAQEGRKQTAALRARLEEVSTYLVRALKLLAAPEAAP